MFKINTIIISVFFPMFFCSLVYSFPRIDDIIIGDSSISIKGNQFGIKSPVLPILWEDFEDGYVDADLPSTGKWQGLSGWSGGKFSSERPYSGNLSAFNRIAGSEAQGPNMGDFNTSQYQFAGTDKLYYSYRWFGQINDPENLSEMRTIRKHGRISSTVGRGVSPNAPSNSGYTGPGSMYYSHGGVAYDPGDRYYSYGSVGNPSMGVWHRHELYKELSTPGVADGRVLLIANGRVLVDETNVMTRNAGETFQHELVLLGLMAAGYSDHPLTDISFFVDDVYVDNTLARVEVGNHSDFWSVTNREIQIPYEWSDTEIKVRINRGTFNASDRLYLFVVDRDGNPSAGYGPFSFADERSGSVQPPIKLELLSN